MPTVYKETCHLKPNRKITDNENPKKDKSTCFCVQSAPILLSDIGAI